VEATALMRKIFKSLLFTLALLPVPFAAALAEVPAWRLWLLQEGKVIEASGHFLVKKTKVVKSARLDIETRKMTISARSDILLHLAYQNSQEEIRLCGRASGTLKGFKLEKKEFAEGELTLSFSVPIEGVEVDMSSIQPCKEL